MKSVRNGKIEFLRFAFSIIIVLFHCQKHLLDINQDTLHFAFFTRGYIGVEFFFVVTGFLLAKTAYKSIQANKENQKYNLGSESAKFVWHKIRVILPYHFVAFAMLFVFTVHHKHYGLSAILEKLLDSVPGLLLIQKAGFNYWNLNSVEWYISCMIIAVAILYPICRNYYSMFVHVIAPVAGILICGYLAYRYGTFTGVSKWNGLGFNCVYRAIAEVSFGAAAFEGARILAARKHSFQKKLLLTVVEISCYLLTFLFVISTIDKKYEIYALLMIVIAVMLTFSNQVYGNRFFNNKVFFLLGEFSLPIYLSQLLAIAVVPAYFPKQPDNVQIILVLILTAVCAAVCFAIGKTIDSLFKSCALRAN